MKLGMTKVKRILTFREDITAGPLLERIVPATFFKTRPGFRVDLNPDVLEGLKVAEPTSAVKLHLFEVTEEANGLEVLEALFDKNEMGFWPIALLLEAQKHGEKGPFTTQFGLANLVVFEGGLLRIRWDNRRREWNLRDEEYEYCGLNVGDRIFGPAGGRILQ